MRTFTVLAGALLALCSICPAAAVFELDTHRNGATPFSSQPWVVATFANTDAPGTVRLTVENRLTGGDFLYSFLFNVTDDIDPSRLVFTPRNGPAAAISTVQESGGNGNNVQAGWFDVAFTYNAGHFRGPGTSIYDISAIGLSESSFLALSLNKNTPPKSTGGYYAAADIRGIVQGSSGSIVALTPYNPRMPMTDTPEPASLGVVAGLIAVAGIPIARRLALRR